MAPEVSAALDSLPEEFRAALLLVDVQELSYQEVSGVLSVPVGTVKSGFRADGVCCGRHC